MNPTCEVLTVKDAAEMMDVTKATVRNHIRKGHFKAGMTDGQWKIDTESFYGFLLAYKERRGDI